MMSTLHKQLLTFVFAIFLQTISNGQIAIQFHNIPSHMTTDGVFATGDELVFTVFNVPNSNTAPTRAASNTRYYTLDNFAGSKLAQVTINDMLDYTKTVGKTQGNAAITEHTDNGDGTFTRKITVTQVIPSSGSYTTGDILFFGYRIVAGNPTINPLIPTNIDFVPTVDNVDDATDEVNPANTTTEVVATLSTKQVNNLPNNIYPNPVKDVLNISTNVVTETYTVSNIAGQILLQAAATGTIDVSSLNPGVYILTTDNGVAKFVRN